jgi:hypothetical protein
MIAQQQPVSFNNTLVPRRREILTISVEISEAQTADILIREGDDPLVLAADFARLHGISNELRELLAEQVQEKLQTFLEEEEAAAL